MEQITVESIPIMVGREDDGRWWADIELMPGVMAYGATRESAIAAVRALALRVAADCIDHGEEIPEPFTKVFSVVQDATAADAANQCAHIQLEKMAPPVAFEFARFQTAAPLAIFNHPGEHGGLI